MWFSLTVFDSQIERNCLLVSKKVAPEAKQISTQSLAVIALNSSRLALTYLTNSAHKHVDCNSLGGGKLPGGFILKSG